MAIILPSGFGMSAIDAWNLTFPSCSALKAANSAPPGPSFPPPKNQGSTISVSVAEGTSPSRICLACGQIVKFAREFILRRVPRDTSPCRGRACRSRPALPVLSRRRASPAIAARRAAACAVRASLQCFPTLLSLQRRTSMHPNPIGEPGARGCNLCLACGCHCPFS